ncbi:hypothetical protein [Candidatus Erwinia dacicola]|uniref:hypothetical protein n=1 Tax=Candidatus Erwinia dacicola TaxID=252393 RepID=UPI0011D13DA7|nr:hypothetical protein [Candidatus Erwinia dacicola]
MDDLGYLGSAPNFISASDEFLFHRHNNISCQLYSRHHAYAINKRDKGQAENLQTASYPARGNLRE